jgi:hypothetical protein
MKQPRGASTYRAARRDAARADRSLRYWRLRKRVTRGKGGTDTQRVAAA